MTILTEGLHTAEYVIQEVGPRALCRKTVSLEGDGTKLKPGSVLGKVTTAVSAAISAAAGNTGDASLSGVTVTTDDDVLEGDYTLTCTGTSTDAGTFEVVAPDGTDIGDLTVGTPFTSAHISLTLPDGTTDWAIDDVVTVTVSPSDVSYTQYDPNATDGSETAAAILFREETPENGSPVETLVTARSTVVDKKALVWSDSVTEFNKKTALAALQTHHIIALD
jgi:hypothetical protein